MDISILVRAWIVSMRCNSWYALVLLHVVLWLVQKTRASSLTNQFKNLKAIATWSPAFFPRFGQFACLYNEFSLASRDSFLSSDWLLWQLWFWFYDTQSKCALYVILQVSHHFLTIMHGYLFSHFFYNISHLSLIRKTVTFSIWTKQNKQKNEVFVTTSRKINNQKFVALYYLNMVKWHNRVIIMLSIFRIFPSLSTNFCGTFCRGGSSPSLPSHKNFSKSRIRMESEVLASERRTNLQASGDLESRSGGRMNKNVTWSIYQSVETMSIIISKCQTWLYVKQIKFS